ncbi:uncharacterized protein Triagg1_3718 [Trichoderma aggressivum f. europaeum]|uniref:Uncharacterized protein n=1 Tax=Trichoderma aggressivum f. europaeum TaxID=173218 RepID=A0AAE1M6M2_9HYPO|nr:hypothetical protein Triagg1_3718 [Trichoderma aggressivum f. europaeum]
MLRSAKNSTERGKGTNDKTRPPESRCGKQGSAASVRASLENPGPDRLFRSVLIRSQNGEIEAPGGEIERNPTLPSTLQSDGPKDVGPP